MPDGTALFGDLRAASIWHPDAINPDEWKYRNLKRVWLPTYDLLAVLAGIVAALQGSPLLNRLFSAALVDTFGVALAVVAAVCLAGVAFPRLWVVEIVGKVILVGLVAAYAATILIFPTSPTPNHFVVLILAFSLPLPLFRLNLLGEEHKERRAAREAREAA